MKHLDHLLAYTVCPVAFLPSPFCELEMNWDVGLRNAFHQLKLLILVPYSLYYGFSSALEILTCLYFSSKDGKDAHLSLSARFARESELILSDFPSRRKRPKPTRKRSRRRRKGGLRRTWHLRRMMKWQLWWASLALVPPRRVIEAFYAWLFAGPNCVCGRHFGGGTGESQ